MRGGRGGGQKEIKKSWGETGRESGRVREKTKRVTREDVREKAGSIGGRGRGSAKNTPPKKKKKKFWTFAH